MKKIQKIKNFKDELQKIKKENQSWWNRQQNRQIVLEFLTSSIDFHQAGFDFSDKLLTRQIHNAQNIVKSYKEEVNAEVTSPRKQQGQQWVDVSQWDSPKKSRQQQEWVDVLPYFQQSGGGAVSSRQQQQQQQQQILRPQIINLFNRIL